MKAAITAIGTANPPYKIDQSTSADMVCDVLNATPAERKLVKALYRFTGIKTRYSVLNDSIKKMGEFDFFPNDTELPFPSTSSRLKIYKENALKLALAAIENCLASCNDADIKSKITHLVTVSCTGMYAPGLDIELVQALNLNASTKRTAINFMGCYGAFNGIKVAEAICQADPNANVLVVCIEICTIHFQRKKDLDNLTSNAIFADGASSALIQGRPTENKYFSLDAFLCDLLPQSSEEMTWHIGDSGFDMVLTSYVPEAIGTGIPVFLDEFSNKFRVSASQIAYYAIHPGAKKILMACEKALNIRAEQIKYSYDTLENYGNMSSATILFVLKKILDQANGKDQDKLIFSCAFGPGLTLESMLIKIHYS